MATVRSGPAPICARGPCGATHRESCAPCQRGNYNRCMFPYRPGKTYRDRLRKRKKM